MIGSSNFSMNFFHSGSRGSGVSSILAEFLPAQGDTGIGQTGFGIGGKNLDDVGEAAHVSPGVPLAALRSRRRQHNISWQLALNIEVELLDRSLLEIEVRGLNCPCIGRWVLGAEQRRTVDQKAIRKAATWRSERSADAGGVRINFRVIRRVLPQPLSALVPGRIVEDPITQSNGSLVTPHGLPGNADAGL